MLSFLTIPLTYYFLQQWSSTVFSGIFCALSFPVPPIPTSILSPRALAHLKWILLYYFLLLFLSIFFSSIRAPSNPILSHPIPAHPSIEQSIQQQQQQSFNCLLQASDLFAGSVRWILCLRVSEWANKLVNTAHSNWKLLFCSLSWVWVE